MRFGADAGRAGIAVFRGDRALDRHLDIGVVEDNERRVAAKFERQLLDRAGALLHQQFAGLGRADEGQLPHDRVGDRRPTDLFQPVRLSSVGMARRAYVYRSSSQLRKRLSVAWITIYQSFVSFGPI